MDKPDIRWEQRLANYAGVLEQLGNAVDIRWQRPLPIWKNWDRFIHSFTPMNWPGT